MQDPIQITVNIPGLDNLIAALERLASAQSEGGFQPPAPPPMTPPPTIPTSAPTYALDDLMRAGSALADAGKREAVVALIGEFGAASMLQVPPERYGEFAARLRGLGAQL
jgi:hypothetical protein